LIEISSCYDENRPAKRERFTLKGENRSMKRNLFTAALVIAAAVSFGLAESEPNGAPGAATGPFTFPNTLTGNFVNDGEGLIDYFSFAATSGQTYQFVASVTNGSSPGLDLAIGVVNGADVLQGGAETDANGVGGAGATETRSFTASSTATFYFYIREATAFANGIQGYSVSAQHMSGVNDWNLY